MCDQSKTTPLHEAARMAQTLANEACGDPPPINFGPRPDASGTIKVPGDNTKTYESGAQREELESHFRFDLISPFALERLAATYAEGAMKYDDHNWRKGMPFSSLMNHVSYHLSLYQQGEDGEDHLAHAAWGLFAMMEFEATDPEQNDLYFRSKEDAETFCYSEPECDHSLGSSAAKHQEVESKPSPQEELEQLMREGLHETPSPGCDHCTGRDTTLVDPEPYPLREESDPPYHPDPGSAPFVDNQLGALGR